MKVEDLIKELERLPKDSTIGMINIDDVRLIEDVGIRTNEYIVRDSIGDEISIKEIEGFRKSNKSKVCDFYIV